MTKPKKPHEPTQQIAVVLKVSDIARLDAQHARFSGAWHQATRSDIVRGLLLPALDEAEKAETRSPGPKPRKRRRTTR